MPASGRYARVALPTVDDTGAQRTLVSEVIRLVESHPGSTRDQVIALLGATAAGRPA